MFINYIEDPPELMGWRRRRRRGRRIKRKVRMRMLFSHHEVKYPRLG